MPLETVLYLGFVIAVMIEFAVVLAYAEWATRHAADNTPRRAQLRRQAAPDQQEVVPARKAA